MGLADRRVHVAVGQCLLERGEVRVVEELQGKALVKRRVAAEALDRPVVVDAVSFQRFRVFCHHGCFASRFACLLRPGRMAAGRF